jgi:hypothetical protein
VIDQIANELVHFIGRHENNILWLDWCSLRAVENYPLYAEFVKLTLSIWLYCQVNPIRKDWALTPPFLLGIEALFYIISAINGGASFMAY